MNNNRRDEIEQMLNDNQTVTYKQLQEIYIDVSTMTLRRDVDYLVAKNKAVKIMGGAKLNKESITQEAIYTSRNGDNKSEKFRIATAAKEYIEPNCSIYLDSGTTLMTLAKLLPNVNLSILTNAPNIALEILKRKLPTVNIIGGLVNPNNISISGSLALATIKNVNLDTVFMAASGYTKNAGFTCGDIEEQKLKSAIIKKSNKVIMLMDSSKMGKTLPFTFAKDFNVDLLITDKSKNSESIASNGKMKIIMV